ncbi:slipin family protein [Luteococcus sp. OSA5]|uniref:slipin family protein n=1 Tax=Luteococcus sp. OSA5 TaxID=3401630 RepID=UPI003B43C07F
MKRRLRHVIVESREAVLSYRHGRLEQAFGPGRHRIVRGRDLVSVDTGVQVLTLKTQEVPCADDIAVKVTLALRWRIIDPVAWHEVSAAPLDLVYLAAQVALRDELARHQAEQLSSTLRTDPEVLARLSEALSPVAAQVGITIEQLVVKDLRLPSELREAVAATVLARHRGQAKLEEARAETAALRSLANAAKLLEANPALARLRMVEAAHYGSTLVVGDLDARHATPMTR